MDNLPPMTPEIEAGLDRVRQKIKQKWKKEDSTIKVSMYQKDEDEDIHNEGDVWDDEQGRTWTLKNGKRESFSKFKDAKTPWFCPKCEKVMNHKNDDIMYRKKGKCFDCVLNDEKEIRHAGVWELYNRIQIRKNQIAFLKDRLSEYRRYRETISAPTFVYESGQVEKWDVDLDTIKADLQIDIDKIANMISALEGELANDQSEYDSKWVEYTNITNKVTN